jgi:hypothetical protein
MHQKQALVFGPLLLAARHYSRAASFTAASQADVSFMCCGWLEIRRLNNRKWVTSAAGRNSTGETVDHRVLGQRGKEPVSLYSICHLSVTVLP